MTLSMSPHTAGPLREWMFYDCGYLGRDHLTSADGLVPRSVCPRSAEADAIRNDPRPSITCALCDRFLRYEPDPGEHEMDAEERTLAASGWRWTRRRNRYGGKGPWLVCRACARPRDLAVAAKSSVV